jgi:cell division protein FtsB
MRWLVLALGAVLLWVQAQLWFGESGQRVLAARQAELAGHVAANAAARERNARVRAEVADLKEGLEMVEEKARAELGMVRPDEVLVRVVTGLQGLQGVPGVRGVPGVAAPAAPRSTP